MLIPKKLVQDLEVLVETEVEQFTTIDVARQLLREGIARRESLLRVWANACLVKPHTMEKE